MIPTTSSLYDLSHTLAAPLLCKTVYPWEALDGIRAFVLKLGETLPADEYDHPQPDVWIAKDVKIAPTASIAGPASSERVPKSVRLRLSAAAYWSGKGA